MTQPCCNGQGASRSCVGAGTSSSVLEGAHGPFEDAAGVLGLSFFSTGAADTGADAPGGCESNADPGVFGVGLVAEPNPNAPDPKPNALEAPGLAVGEDIPVVANGAMLLNGLERPP
jgi:hypothetical protein